MRVLEELADKFDKMEFDSGAEFGVKYFSKSNTHVPWSGKFVAMYGEASDYHAFETLADALSWIHGRMDNRVSPREQAAIDQAKRGSGTTRVFG